MGSRIGRPERPAGLAVLVALVVAQVVGWGAGVGLLLWLSVATQSTP